MYMKHFRYILLTLALMVTFVVPQTAYAEEITTGVVDALLGLRLRNGPGTGYGITTTLSHHSKVTILGTDRTGYGCDSAWLKVRTSGNLEGYVCSDYIIEIETHEMTQEEIDKQNQLNSLSATGEQMANMTDAEFEQYLDSQGFPESYKVKLRELHKLHPTWIFKGIKSKYDWTTALNYQDTTGTSLINVNSTYAAKGWEGYLSIADSDYNHLTNKFIPHDGTYWFQANRQAIAYFIDARNFLNEKEIFMFEEMFLHESYQTEDMVKTVLGSAFLKQFSSYFIEAGVAAGVSPIFLASLSRIEVGTSSSNIVTNGNAGVLSDGVDYTHYYNFFNIGASSSPNPKLKSLQYAKSAGWNTEQKAIVNGAKIISNNYVNCGQYTSYFQKFNFAPTATKGMWHQYSTAIMALQDPATSQYNAYKNAGLIEKDFVFAIPYFDGMPESTSLPSLGNPNYWLSNLYVNGSLVTNFDTDNQYYTVNVDYAETVTIAASPIVSSATVSNTGVVNLTGSTTVIPVTVTAQNGGQRTYYVTVNRANKPVEPDPVTPDPVTPDPVTPDPVTPDPVTPDPEPNKPSVDLNEVVKSSSFYGNDTYIWNVTLGSTVSSMTEELTKKYNTVTVNIFDKNNNNKSQGRLVTGDKVTISSNGTTKTLTVLIYGDVDGSGTISAVDLLHIQKHILGFTKLTGPYITAADINKDGKITASDLLQIQKHILNYSNISQG